MLWIGDLDLLELRCCCLIAIHQYSSRPKITMEFVPQLRYTMLCHAMYAVLRYSMQCNAVQSNGMLCCKALHAMPYMPYTGDLLRFAMLFYPALYFRLSCKMLYDAFLWNA